jgi:UDP-glucose 4-epimerase
LSSATSNEQFYWNDNATNYTVDILDYDKLYDIFHRESPDQVFHLAAEARIQRTIDAPIEACLTNTAGTVNVLQAAKETNVKRVIYSSTSSAYGLANDSPLHEEMQRDCLNPYSVSKCAGEDWCKMFYTLYGLETVTFRYFNVYGERQPVKGQYAPVIGIFLRQAKAGEPMTVVGDGLQTRDYTHVSDVIKANLAAMTTSKGLGEIHNIGTGHSYSVLDLVEMVGGSRIHIPPRPGESRHTKADIKRALENLGWSPTISLKEWIAQQK